MKILPLGGLFLYENEPEIKQINPTAMAAAETPKPTSIPEWVWTQTRTVRAISSPMQKAK